MRKILYNSEDINLDSGLLFGKGVFETILVKDKPVFLEEHINRLNASIEYLYLGKKLDIEDVVDFINNKKIENKVLRITITEKNLIYTTRDIKYKKEDYIKGFKLKLSPVLRNNTSKLVGVKSLNYLENLMEYELANKEGFNEALFLNVNGQVAECCTSNIFIIKDKQIITPTVDSGILSGVMRKWVISNFKVQERAIGKEELFSCEEIFLTNSVVGIIKVSEFEGKIYSDYITNKISEKYLEFLHRGDDING